MLCLTAAWLTHTCTRLCLVELNYVFHSKSMLQDVEEFSLEEKGIDSGGDLNHTHTNIKSVNNHAICFALNL